MAGIHRFLTLLAIIPFVTPQCTLKVAQLSYTRSVHEFSAQLLRRISQDTDGHFVSSTLSPYTLISALALGAADETLAEIKRVLHHKNHRCFDYKYLKLSKQVLSSDESAILERSGVLFADESLELKDVFQRRLTATGVCEIVPISFGDFAAAAFRINDFVKSATHGIIDEIVAASDLEGVYLMMIDALYFKGTWRTSFSLENTQRSPFYDDSGNAVGEVNMMYMSEEFNVTVIKSLSATVLELPYGQGRFSMLIFLPQEGSSINNVINKLSEITLHSVFSQFERLPPQTVSVRLPRFKISTDLTNLKELLIDMGLHEMFQPNLAKFPLLSDYQLHVSSFVQKADIEVTEEGTVAAAATSVGLSFRSFDMLNIEFIANRPFVYMVVDRDTEVAVISGAYSKPSLY